MKANMAYPGGKNGAGVFQRIICQMPPHHTYVEPFAGGLALLEQNAFERDTLIYCDPPYLETAVLSRLRYRHVLSVEDHRRLLKILKRQQCLIMISGYWSRLYQEKLSAAAGWRAVQFASMTRGGYKCQEWLWMNYPAPSRLHDYRYVGANYREREKFRRQQRRWSTRLGRMDPLQRLALMSVLEAALGEDLAHEVV
jgi:DNA adenine methylase